MIANLYTQGRDKIQRKGFNFCVVAIRVNEVGLRRRRGTVGQLGPFIRSDILIVILQSDVIVSDAKELEVVDFGAENLPYYFKMVFAEVFVSVLKLLS